MASTIIQMVGDPVLFLGQGGGGVNEYGFPDMPNAPTSAVINFPIPAGAQVVDAWYSVIDQVNLQYAFETIDVLPTSSGVVIKARGIHKAAALGGGVRIRIRIHAAIQVP